MTVRLNTKAFDRAQTLIKQGKAVHDERDDWSEHAPTAQQQNTWLEKHDFEQYALWFLGVDDDASEETKGKYSFPYGDFAKVHRCGLISLESRAAQNHHDDLTKAAKKLLELLDD